MFVEEYLTVLAESLKTVLNQMLSKKFNDIAYEQHLKHYIDISKNILEHANSKVTEEKEVYYWMYTIKKICARFQEMASVFLTDLLQASPQELSRIKDELNRKLIIATVLVEMKYQTKLCEEYNFCPKSHEVTNSLNTLLEKFKTTHDDKVRLFIKYFYEALFDTSFYSHVSEKSAHELQLILNDMAYSSEVPTKDILRAVQEVVKARLEVLKTNKGLKMSHDAILMRVILSDMDYIYSVHPSDPFKKFFKHFYDWVGADVKISRVIRQTMNDIGTELQTAPDDILVKIISEVRVFLELTVEPENKR
ncbi:jg20580 [Pararge aegeria aegeria]|uniref:Jg20580 protein n=1 Tax=Pararge aegeria aegeria TaxID=348720 RepID=A0A8S4RQ12_9NEOP|nr:jg20580 [Pararge aegeria aegeria]